MDVSDGGDKFLSARVFEEEATGTSMECIVDVLVEVECREYEDFGRGVESADEFGGHDPVHRWHAHIHDDDVEILFLRQLVSLGAVLS